MAQLDRKKVPYLSHSKVSLVKRCPRCYYRQYVLREDQDSAAMWVGRLFHQAASELYKSNSSSAPPRLFAQLKTRGMEEYRVSTLRNAITLLCENRWNGLEVASVEEPFFLDLASDLPPIIGIADLILRKGGTVTVIDHKTSKTFNDHDDGQLVLYAEHARRRHEVRRVKGFFDEYRLVTNLSTIRKPAFRRTEAEVGRRLLSPLIENYREAWGEIQEYEGGDEPAPGYECWTCKSQHFSF